MKFKQFYWILLFCLPIMACQKIEVPTEIKSFYPESIDGASYANATIYEVEKADGETFEIIFNFEGGSGFEELKIVNFGLNAQLSYHATQEATDIFNISSPEKGSLKGPIVVTGQFNYSQFYTGATSDIDKFSFQFFLVDKMGVTRSVIIKFVKP